jgi:glutathione synthase
LKETTMSSRRYRVLFVMDPYPSLNLATETSLLLIDALLARGHAVSWAEREDISLAGDRLQIDARAVRQTAPLQLDPPRTRDGDDFDAVLIRIDPPVDTGYLQLMQLLDRLPPRVLQVNPARALIRLNEKLLAMRFARFTPPSLATMSLPRLREFVHAHREAVLKPLGDCSGRGIVFVDAAMPGLDAALTAMLRDAHGTPRFIQAQAFLPGIAGGDKRVLLFDGEVIGMVNRIPAAGSRLGNIHQGARVEAAVLSRAEAACLEALQPMLREQQLHLVGADFIDGRLTELNITSPSALRQINAVSGLQLEQRIVDRLLQRLDAIAGDAHRRSLAEIDAAACE